MANMASSGTNVGSFYGPVDDSQRQALLQAYLDTMVARDGQLDRETGTLPRREASLAEMNASGVRFEGKVSQAAFDRLYTSFSPAVPGLKPELVLLLTLCKMNAAEAYGVRVVRAAYERRQKGVRDLRDRVILYAQEEEEYHTRILVGSARYFDVQVEGAYLPKLALKVLIQSLVYAPKPLFHPILYGSEVAGVFLFNWTLHRVGSIVQGQPELQEALEQRLIEILVDEIGHIAFNRLVMGPNGLRLGRILARQTARGMPWMTRELAALGYNQALKQEFGRFDLPDLPQEVRRRGFFA